MPRSCRPSKKRCDVSTKGTYGICRDCGEPIAAARLNAIPWTRVCISCKAKQEVVTDLPALLREFYRDKLTEMLRYDRWRALCRTAWTANNTYQHVINREETQLSWVGHAILDLGGSVEANGSEPERKVAGKGAVAMNTVLDEDIHSAQQFLERWRPLVDAMSDVHARQRNMLSVILNETVEQKRFFEQARAGRTDLLGRRTEGVGKPGEVMATRWIE